MFFLNVRSIWPFKIIKSRQDRRLILNSWFSMNLAWDNEWLHITGFLKRSYWEIRTINLALHQLSESIFICYVVRDAGPYKHDNQIMWNLMQPSKSYLAKLSSNFWNSLDLGISQGQKRSRPKGSQHSKQKKNSEILGKWNQVKSKNLSL